MNHTELKKEIEESLKKVYSGSSHTGDIYNNEAVSEIMQLFTKHKEEEKIEAKKEVLKEVVAMAMEDKTFYANKKPTEKHLTVRCLYDGIIMEAESIIANFGFGYRFTTTQEAEEKDNG